MDCQSTVENMFIMSKIYIYRYVEITKYWITANNPQRGESLEQRVP